MHVCYSRALHRMNCLLDKGITRLCYEFGACFKFDINIIMIVTIVNSIMVKSQLLQYSPSEFHACLNDHGTCT